MYRVSVVDAVSGAAICDAEVSVSGVAAPAYEPQCDYAAPIPPGDSAEVEVTKDGYQAATQQVSTAYDTDECDKAVAKRVKVSLQPL